MPTPDLSGVQAVTFDCFGTLIDWPTGILAALRPLADKHGLALADGALLARYAELEREVEAGGYVTYREVLRRVVRGLFGERAGEDDAHALERALVTWQPFPDTVGALRRLADKYRLGVLSNVDDDLFEPILATLGRPFEVVVTAQQVRSYKPAEGHFREALARLGLEAGEVLHAAESRFHDVETARGLGFRTAWVNRGRSASGPSEARPDVEVASVAALADLLDA
ncbi:MAG: haloacid dehalogenase type II [Phycisphaerales bacterium]